MAGVEALLERNVIGPDPMPDVAILDTGAQYGALVDRRAREWGIRTVVTDISTPAEDIAALNPVGVIIPGGPESTYDEGAPHIDSDLLELGVPVLGICYGQHEIARAMGGTVLHTSAHETSVVNRQDGRIGIQRTDEASDLLQDMPDGAKVLMTHGDSVVEAPEGCVVTATSDGIIAAFEDPAKKIYATQFHPEASDTEYGEELFDRFFSTICEQEPSYSLDDQMEESIADIKRFPADSQFVVALSGGVDSAVAARLLLEADVDPERIHLVHVDHGYMRENESSQIVEEFSKLGVSVTVIDAFEEFANARYTYPDGSQSSPLKELTQGSAEIKRKIMGETFAQIFERYITEQELENAVMVQGTLRPDLIESGHASVSGRAHNVVTHHNVTQTTEQWREEDRVVEPNKNLHKDQVRRVGRHLGLPDSIVQRMPFPGPGLGVRILGHDGASLDDSPVKLLNGNVFDEDARAELEGDVRSWFLRQGYADIGIHVVGMLSRGARGDASSDGLVAAYETLQGKPTPSWSEMVEVGMELTNTFPDLIRFTNLTANDPKSQEQRRFSMVPTSPDASAVAMLQKADAHAHWSLYQSGEESGIAQLPVILAPASTDGYSHSIVLRPFVSPDFMTGRAAVPGEDLSESLVRRMIASTLAVSGIAAVFYDLTHKPPGRTEWE